jgi:hypothetical protein
MLTDKEERELEKLRKYFRKEGRDTMLEELQHEGESARNLRFTNLAKHAQAIIETQDRDEELNSLKDKVKELNKPYNDQKNANKKLQRLVRLTMKEDGQVEE